MIRVLKVLAPDRYCPCHRACLLVVKRSLVKFQLYHNIHFVGTINGKSKLSGERKKFNVNFIVKTSVFLYNRDTVGASCIVSSAELQ